MDASFGTSVMEDRADAPSARLLVVPSGNGREQMTSFAAVVGPQTAWPGGVTEGAEITPDPRPRS